MEGDHRTCPASAGEKAGCAGETDRGRHTVVEKEEEDIDRREVDH